MKSEEFQVQDAMGLADLITRKEVCECEVLDAALERIGEVNGTLNAVINDREDEARQAFAQALPDGPLRGVPFLLKDLGVLDEGRSHGWRIAPLQEFRTRGPGQRVGRRLSARRSW